MRSFNLNLMQKLDKGGVGKKNITSWSINSNFSSTANGGKFKGQRWKPLSLLDRSLKKPENFSKCGATDFGSTHWHQRFYHLTMGCLK